MILGMTVLEESQANTLCKSCGLCCTGHLFIWTKLRSVELKSVEALGVKVFRSPGERGFNQPCPLWKGICTIYTTAAYPHFCQTYKCKLLKALLNESIVLGDALARVEEAKQRIAELEVLFPAAPTSNFRERLMAYLESQEQPEPQVRAKADELLIMYEQIFGVDDLIDKSEGD